MMQIKFKKKISEINDNKLVYLPKEICEALNLNKGDRVEIFLGEAGQLIIEKSAEAETQETQEVDENE